MASIALEAERGFPVSVDLMSPTASLPEAVMQSAVHLAHQVSAVALVVSTVSVRPSTRTWSPGFGTPPMRW